MLLRLILGALLLVALFLSGHVHRLWLAFWPSTQAVIPGSPNTTPPSPSNRTLAQECWEVYDEWRTRCYDQSFIQGHLRRLIDKLPEVKISPVDGSAVIQSCNLAGLAPDEIGNDRRVAMYRFRSPFQEPADLHLLIAAPTLLSFWSIQPLAGPVPKVDCSVEDWNIAVPQTNQPFGNTIYFQQILGHQIMPGQDYVICFKPDQGELDELHVALRLTTSETAKPATTLEEAGEALGIRLQPLTFEDTPAGLQQAYREAAKLVRRIRYHPQAVGRMLHSVRKQIPEFKTNIADNRASWKELVPQSVLDFQAFRLTNPFDQPCDFQWCYCVNKEPLMSGIASLEKGFVQVPDKVRYEVNCPIPELAGYEENLFILQNITGGQFHSRGEYLLWLAPRQGTFPKCHTTGRFTPPGTIVDDASAHDIGQLLGIDIPKTLTPERVQAGLQRVQDVIRTHSKEYPDIAHLLRFLRPALPSLPSNDETAVWTSIPLGSVSGPATVYRLPRSPDSQQVVAALARATDENCFWGFISEESRYVVGSQMKEQRNIALEGIELPPDSIFQTISQRLELNEEPWYLLISPSQPEPMTCSVTVRASTDDLNQNTSLQDALDTLGLRVRGLGDPGGVFAQQDEPVARIVSLGESDRLATLSPSGILRTGTSMGRQLQAHSNLLSSSPRQTAISRSGNRMAVLNEDPTVTIIDLQTQRVQQTLPLPVSSLSFRMSLSKDGSSLLALSGSDWGYDPDLVLLWDLEQPASAPRSHEYKERFYPSAGALHPDRITLVLCGTSYVNRDQVPGFWIAGVLQIVDSNGWQVLHEIRETNATWHQVAVSEDGRRLVGLLSSGEVLVWDFQSRTLTGVLCDLKLVAPFYINRVGSRLLIRTQDSQLMLYDVDSMQLLQSWPADQEYASAFWLDKEGQTILLGGGDGRLRQLVVDDNSPPADALKVPRSVSNSLGMKLVRIPAGQFEMGASLRDAAKDGMEDEQPRHNVHITKPFYIGACEVTVAEFRRFADATNYRTTAETSGIGGSHQFSLSEYRADPSLNWRNPGFTQTDVHPVVQVSWHDAQAFCRWLSQKEGRIYRLPTEAEWEYACRGGSKSRWCYGDRLEGVVRFGNVADAMILREYGEAYQAALRWPDGYVFSAPVGSYLPNSVGLYDMHGNVWEWCQDAWDDTYYKRSPVLDPANDGQAAVRSQRGGGFLNRVWDSRSANRDYGPTGQVQSSLGFRVVCEIHDEE